MDEINFLSSLFDKLDNSKKNKAKKLAALLKYGLFTQIYQLKGQQIMNELIQKIKFKQYSFGFNIIESKQRNFCYIIKGAAMVFVNKQNNDIPTFYKRIGQFQYFGQKIKYNNMKLHSVKSVSNTYVLQLDLYTFYKTFSGYFQYPQLKEKINFLQTIWIFKSIKKRDIQRILLLSKTVKYVKNHIIFKPNQNVNYAYLILSGQLSLFNGKQSFKGFKILGQGQICGLQQIKNNTKYQYGSVSITQYVMVLQISRNLVQQVFIQNIDYNMYEKKKILNQNIIYKKQQKQMKILIKQMNGRYQLNNKIGRNRYHSQVYQRQQSLFKIDKQKISKQNILKDKQLRQVTLQKIRNSQRQLQNQLGLSTYSNAGFTQDKQLLLSYLVKKEKKKNQITLKQLQYQQQNIYVIPQFPIQRSPAVKNHKRKLKKSRKNVQSLSTIY